jgi:hypothetical protein
MNRSPLSSLRPRLRPAGLGTPFEGVNPNGPFQFPLEDETDYKGRISFTAYKTEQPTAGELFLGLVSPGGNGATANGAGVVEPRIQSPAKSQVAAAKAQNSKLKTIKKPIPQRVGNDRTCSLYLPQSIQFSDRVEYTNIDLGIVGAATAAGIASGVSGKDIMKAIGGAVLPDFESVQEAFTMGLQSEAAQVAALRVARNVSGGVQGAIETTTGVALNPNRRATLKGVGLRQFRFAFKMIPTSAAEAKMIKAIVQFFREEMYPEARYISQISAAYRFPAKFKIRLSYGGKSVATGILPCFLESVDVVYNPNAMAFHTDGNPQETDISLNFIEERTLHKYDVAVDGY